MGIHTEALAVILQPSEHASFWDVLVGCHTVRLPFSARRIVRHRDEGSVVPSTRRSENSA